MPENQVFNFNYYQLCYNYYDQSLDMTPNSSKIHHCSNEQSIKPTFLQKNPCKPCWTDCQPTCSRTKNVWERAVSNVWHSSQGACARQYMVRQAGCWASPPAHPPFPSLCDSANLFHLSTQSLPEDLGLSCVTLVASSTCLAMCCPVRPSEKYP